jgi:peptidoglycan/xylan/chitin deacetylase (PgdA/CDA1 family)
MRHITVFFDFEGQWGMPFKAKYDLASSVANILAILRLHKLKAVFNTSSVILEAYPEVIRKIDHEDHELAFHGYRHENYLDIRPKEFDVILKKTGQMMYNLIGKRPQGVRFPFLLDPLFYDPVLYEVMEQNDYIWASNRQVRSVEELLLSSIIFKKSIYKILLNNKLLNLPSYHKTWLLFLNKGLIVKDRVIKPSNNYLLQNIDWLLNKQEPFFRNNILEIPLLSTMDCFLLGTPSPHENSTVSDCDQAQSLLTRELSQKSNGYLNLNFHDWIIGSANRLDVLDKTIGNLTRLKDIDFLTATELAGRFKKHD